MSNGRRVINDTPSKATLFCCTSSGMAKKMSMCIKVTRRGCCFSGICGKKTLRWNRRNNVFFRYMRFYRHLSFRMCSNVMIIKNKETRVDVPILHVGVCTNRTRITREVIYRSAQLSISGNLLMWLQGVCQTGFDAPGEKIRVTLVRKGNSTFGFKIPLLRKCYRHVH